MESYCSDQNGFLEELLALKTDPFEAILPMPFNDNFYTINGWNYDIGFLENTISIPQNSVSEDYSFPVDHHQSLISSSLGGEIFNFNPFGGELPSPPDLTDNSSNTCHAINTPQPFLSSQEDYNSLTILEDEEQGFVGNALHCFELQAPCKVETVQSGEMPAFKMGISSGKKKKLNGQPSKNLMAERRRRKRLNDRLSMLRSVVPKISKMDRTSILGDTIDYMKELLERIHNLQEEMEKEGTNNDLILTNIFKDVKPNEVLFEVERRNKDTRIEICCASKPGLLLSTMTTLEALGVEIQQCVISCFNDFSMHASCSEDVEQRADLTSEDIKQTLFRNAGYGGRCL